MASSSHTTSAEELLDGTLGLAVGLGIITMALFPFAIPLLALTAVALIPLLLIALVAGLLAVPFLLFRRLVRKAAASPRENHGETDPRASQSPGLGLRLSRVPHRDGSC